LPSAAAAVTVPAMTGKPSEKAGKKSASKPDVKATEGTSLIIKNRRAFFEYEVSEEWEAGIALLGTEVKSLRAGQIQLADAYARFDRGELYLVNVNISPYKMGGYANHVPTRPRKLLLHKRELSRISAKVEQKGFTLIPLSFFWRRGLCKVTIGLCRGKKLHDKRQAIAKRDASRAVARGRDD
jgi:SsrA-binding protein